MMLSIFFSRSLLPLFLTPHPYQKYQEQGCRMQEEDGENSYLTYFHYLWNLKHVKNFKAAVCSQRQKPAVGRNCDGSRTRQWGYKALK